MRGGGEDGQPGALAMPCAKLSAVMFEGVCAGTRYRYMLRGDVGLRGNRKDAQEVPAGHTPKRGFSNFVHSVYPYPLAGNEFCDFLKKVTPPKSAQMT